MLRRACRHDSEGRERLVDPPGDRLAIRLGPTEACRGSPAGGSDGLRWRRARRGATTVSRNDRRATGWRQARHDRTDAALRRFSSYLEA